MKKINIFNIKQLLRRLIGSLILLNLLEIIYIFIISSSFFSLGMEIKVLFPVFFLLIWSSALFWYLKIKETREVEALRQKNLEKKIGNKRHFDRVAFSRMEDPWVTFQMPKDIPLGRKIQRTAKLMDISEGGLLVRCLTRGIREGDKLKKINIRFGDHSTIITDGLVVTVRSEEHKLGIIFDNLNAKERSIINGYVLKRSTKNKK